MNGQRPPIREWPPEDRPRERFLTKGADALSDAECLALLLGGGGPGQTALDQAQALLATFGSHLESLKKEVFRVALLDSQNGLLRDVQVSEGSLSASIVHPREVFRTAILEATAHLILVHNHPSGDPTPSKEDVHLTRQLVEGARLLGLRVHDHVIIGRGSHVSLAQRGLL